MITPINKFTRDQLREAFRELKLPGACDAFQEQCDNPTYAELPFEDRVGIMLERELASRRNRRESRLLKEAGLSHCRTYPEHILYEPERNLDAALIKELFTCSWIKATPTPWVLITGATGTGKTWLAKALGVCACQHSHSVMYIRFAQLLEGFEDAALHNSSVNYRRRLSNKDLLIIDDFGLGQMTQRTRTDFLSLIEERLGNCAIVLVSQLPIKGWQDYIGEVYCSDALTDRIVNSSYRINLKGPSLRERSRPQMPAAE